MIEHVIGDLVALGDPLLGVVPPVDSQEDPALGVVLLGLREAGKLTGLGLGVLLPGSLLCPLYSSETTVNAGPASSPQYFRRVWKSAPPKTAWPEG